VPNRRSGGGALPSYGDGLAGRGSVCFPLPRAGGSELWRYADQALDALREAVELYLENAKILGMLPDLESTLAAPHRFCSVMEVSVP